MAIGKTNEDGGDAKALATKVLSEAYDYDKGSVFFKPTLAYGKNTFRPTKEGALAYFVGGNPNFPEDKGFALKPWVKARYDNLGDGDEGIQIHGNIAITMGNVWVTDKDGNETMVDKTFVFKKGDDGKLKLIVHTSALPYNPAKYARDFHLLPSSAGTRPAGLFSCRSGAINRWRNRRSRPSAAAWPAPCPRGFRPCP